MSEFRDLLKRRRMVRSYLPDPIVAGFGDYDKSGFNVLAALGVKCVRTLGIDGGIHYSRDFHDLNGVTRLANGQIRGTGVLMPG